MSHLLLHYAWTSICRHVYDWNIVDSGVEQPFSSPYLLYSKTIIYKNVLISDLRWPRVGAWTGTLKNPTQFLWRWEPDRMSHLLPHYAWTSICRHIYDWNIVDSGVKQPFSSPHLLYSKTIIVILVRNVILGVLTHIYGFPTKDVDVDQLSVTWGSIHKITRLQKVHYFFTWSCYGTWRDVISVPTLIVSLRYFL